jgi:hypothetical protein
VECQLKQKEEQARLQDLEEKLKRTHIVHTSQRLEPCKLLTLLPALREWLHSLRKVCSALPNFCNLCWTYGHLLVYPWSTLFNRWVLFQKQKNSFTVGYFMIWCFLGMISHLILVCPTWNEWLLESFKRVSMKGRMDDQSVFLRLQHISQFAVVITNCSDPNW